MTIKAVCTPSSVAETSSLKSSTTLLSTKSSSSIFEKQKPGSNLVSIFNPALATNAEGAFRLAIEINSYRSRA